MTAMGCIFLSQAKEKANGAFGIGHTKNQERWGWGVSQTVRRYGCEASIHK